MRIQTPMLLIGSSLRIHKRACYGHTPALTAQRKCEICCAKHKLLWADLAFRSEHASAGIVAPEWRAAFNEFPNRFMVGTDTFAPERWYYVGKHAAYSRNWLASLPPALARKIGYQNAEAMLGLIAPSSGKTQ